MPKNMSMASSRLRSLDARLSKNQDMKEKKYSKNIKKLLEDGYAEVVLDDEIDLDDGSVWYLPHRGVVSESKPDKVHVVFHCAATEDGINLNNQCMQGPDLNNKLTGILMRFRSHS